jgi:hypothetical protein
VNLENAPDISAVKNWLLTAGIESLCHWDTLVFLYRHQASLVSAEHISSLLGYATGEVVAALEHLESLEFVKPSRASQGVRLYQSSAPVDPPRGDSFDRLMSLADSRAVRLLLAKRWRRGDRSDPNKNHSPLPDTERGKTWLKAS